MQENISLNELEEILNAVLVEGPKGETNSVQTLYRTIFDLKKKEISLYY